MHGKIDLNKRRRRRHNSTRRRTKPVHSPECLALENDSFRSKTAAERAIANILRFGQSGKVVPLKCTCGELSFIAIEGVAS